MTFCSHSLPRALWGALLAGETLPCWQALQGEREWLVAMLREELAGGSPRRQRETVVWLLDRLLPLEERDLFEPFARRSAAAALAWGRRLHGTQRGLLLAVAAEGEPQTLVQSAVQAAWCETSALEPPEAVFDWTRHAPPGIHAWPSTLVETYRDRVPNQGVRLAGLTRLALEAELHLESMTGYNPWRALLEVVVQQAVQDAVSALGPPEPTLPAEEVQDAAWATWLLGSLRGAGHLDLAELVGRHHREAGFYRLPAQAWVWRHDASTWQQLVDDFHRLEDLIPYSVITQMGTVVPPERVDAWEVALEMEHRGNDPVVEFCRWLRPEYRDVLPAWMKRLAWADAGACVWQAYLHAVPRPVLEHLWSKVDELPLRQARVLDRLLFAPPELRPPRVVEDVQKVEADPRRMDLVNHRGF